jgi:hypothetical protein
MEYQMKDVIYVALWIWISFDLIQYSSLALMKPHNSYVDIAVAVFAFFGVKAVLTSVENFYYWFNDRE